jgi:dolichol kinase
MQAITMALMSLPLLAFVFLNPCRLPSYMVRKALHMGTGTLLIMVDPSDPLLPWGMHSVTALFVLTVCVRELHISDLYDVGIINYLLACSICVAFHVRFSAMAPLFYADPLGALVGRNLRTKKLVGSKSVGGTLAVFVTAALTVAESTWPMRLWSGFLISMLELFGGKMDNVLIAGYLFLRYAYS